MRKINKNVFTEFEWLAADELAIQINIDKEMNSGPSSCKSTYKYEYMWNSFFSGLLLSILST